eukprot:m.353254 g.353254  ORF g.353254 m.353254 type:complete len:302 (-) comp16718_c0_seq1:4871-5776(-)
MTVVKQRNDSQALECQAQSKTHNSSATRHDCLDVLLHQLGNLKHHVGLKKHCPRTVHYNLVLVGNWCTKAEHRLVTEERKSLSLVLGEDADAFKADTKPQLLGPLFAQGLGDLKQITAITLPCLDDLHEGFAGIVLAHALQLLPLLNNAVLYLLHLSVGNLASFLHSTTTQTAKSALSKTLQSTLNHCTCLLQRARYSTLIRSQQLGLLCRMHLDDVRNVSTLFPVTNNKLGSEGSKTNLHVVIGRELASHDGLKCLLKEKLLFCLCEISRTGLVERKQLELEGPRTAIWVNAVILILLPL